MNTLLENETGAFERIFHNIAIFGASGAIGSALIQQLSIRYPNATITGISQQTADKVLSCWQSHLSDTQATALANRITLLQTDYLNELQLQQTAETISANQPLDLVIVATGILHTESMMPEKAIKDLSLEKFQTLFAANTIAPALIMKHCLPKLNKQQPVIFAGLSARVGSISDNQKGGWYAYRASKAALNMIIKNAAIEMRRSHKQAIIVGLHPGTVDSTLSKPFQQNVPENKLFTAEYSASCLLNVLTQLTPNESGLCFAWDGKVVEP